MKIIATKYRLPDNIGIFMKNGVFILFTITDYATFDFPEEEEIVTIQYKMDYVVSPLDSGSEYFFLNLN